LQLRRRCVV